MEYFNNINSFTDEQGTIVKLEVQQYKMADKPELLKSLDVVIGGEYIVQPENPRKLKHRDRIVTVRSFLVDDIGNPIRASVKFQDNNAVGKVDVRDLAAIEG